MRLSPRALALPVAIGTLLTCAIAPAPSHAAPAIRVVRDISLPGLQGTPVRVDLWRRAASPRTSARAARPQPVALLVHGGGWHSGDKRQWEHSRWAQRLASRGWLVVSTNYRMACDPATLGARQGAANLCGHAMRTSISDVRTSLRSAAARATSWGADPTRIVLFGASAGAQLAMIAASQPDRPPGVRAVVAISPPTDLAWIGATPDLPLYPSAARSLGCALDVCPDAWTRASPISRVRARVTPPTWLFVSGADPVTPIGPVRAYAERLRSALVPTMLVTTADPLNACHGPVPCAGASLTDTPLDLFSSSQAWLAAQLR